MSCECGSGAGYDECCGEIHRSDAGLGRTAEQLMRARYCAYARGDRDFLARSWHPATRPADLTLDPDTEWTGLDIVETEAGGALAAKGVVEFVAHFRRHGSASSLHERSTFERVDGNWRYLTGS